MDSAAIETLAPFLVARGFAAVEVEYRRCDDEGGAWPGTALDVLAALERAYVPGDAVPLDEQLGARATAAVDWMWAQSDALVVAFANNANLGYPAWWLESPDVGYVDGPSARRGLDG